MSCQCSQYEPIELCRPSIRKRIKATRAIKRELEVVATNNENNLTLFKCPTCGQLWQNGREWNFGNDEYVFQVPETSVVDWLTEPYQQPAAMMIYDAVMSRFEAGIDRTPSNRNCKHPDCNEAALRNTVHCRTHHIEAMQRTSQLPPAPTGRVFPPYHYNTMPRAEE
jgi:predicted RNA-binding Zn-ribbon protein involved in translation (DUF1610 family)